MRYIFERTSLVYFFANQLEMLEITNLETATSSPASPFQSRGLDAAAHGSNQRLPQNFRSLVNRWQQMQADFQAVSASRQTRRHGRKYRWWPGATPAT